MQDNKYLFLVLDISESCMDNPIQDHVFSSDALMTFWGEHSEDYHKFCNMEESKFDWDPISVFGVEALDSDEARVYGQSMAFQSGISGHDSITSLVRNTHNG